MTEITLEHIIDSEVTVYEEISIIKNQLGFDHGTIRAFTMGDCWRLALDLHKKLNYSVFVVTNLEIVLTDQPSEFFHHMVVKNQFTGDFLDVHGKHTEAELLAYYGQISDSPVICDVTNDLDSSAQDYITAFVEFDASLVGDILIERLQLTRD